ncbi:MAG: DUF1735 domain-containing protein [Bacteroidales bacterium]|nr:DUF1735 domain-containing protein [Bacteroidales bacterium]
MKTLYKTIRITAGVVLLALLAVSCLPEQQSMGDAGTTIVKAYPANESGFKLIVLDASNQPQSFSMVEVRRDAANQTDLNSTTTVELTFDANGGILNTYNTKHGTNYITLPTSVHTTAPALTGGKVSLVFGPGDFVKELTLNVPNAYAIDMSKTYALAYKMTVTGTGVRSLTSSDSLVIQVMPKNEYDGLYDSEGSFNHPASGGEDWVQDDTYDRWFSYVGADAKEGITSGANTIDCWAGDVGYDMVLTVLATTIDVGGVAMKQVNVFVVPRPNDHGMFTATEAPQTPGLPCNYYDHINKKFVLYYYYGTAPNRRKIYEELTWAAVRPVK